MGPKPSQTANTDTPALDAESFSSAVGGSPIPWWCGEGAPVVRWISPIYKQRTIKASGGKKSGGGTTNYAGTLIGVFGIDGLDDIQWILDSGRLVFTGPLDFATSANPVDITLSGLGSFRLRWGTESQISDGLLDSYEPHPPYKSLLTIEALDAQFGTQGESQAPNLKICGRRSPRQSIVTGSPSAIDGHSTCNPIAITAELLTSWQWGDQPASLINVSSAQATANSFNAETVSGTNRIQTSMAPFISDRTSIRSLFSDIAEMSDAWMRLDSNGKIEFGRWVPNASTSVTCTEFTFADFEETGVPQGDGDNIDDLPNGCAVEFRLASGYHRKDGVTIPNIAKQRRVGSSVKIETVSTNFLIDRDMAARFGSRWNAKHTNPSLNQTLLVRRLKCVNPDGSPIRPGDYVRVPMHLRESGTPMTGLFRVLRKKTPVYGEIKLEVRRDIAAPLQPPTKLSPEPLVITTALPPIQLYRLYTLPPDANGNVAVAPLLCRPADMATDAEVLYSPSGAGVFQSLGTTGFALPLALNSAVSLVAGTIRVQTLPAGSHGENYQRDLDYITDWTGGATEGADDQMLIIAISTNAGPIDQLANGRDKVEILSVNGTASIVSAGVYDIPVLRGRQGTDTQAFATGSFPDAFTNYQLWMIPRASLLRAQHANFNGLVGSGLSTDFEFYANSIHGQYNPHDAYIERTRRNSIGAPLLEFYSQPDGTTVRPAPSFTFADFVVNQTPAVSTATPVSTDGFSVAWETVKDVMAGTWLAVPSRPGGQGEWFLEYTTTAASAPGPSDSVAIGTFQKTPLDVVRVPVYTQKPFIGSTHVYTRYACKTGLRSKWVGSPAILFAATYAGNVGYQNEDSTALSGLTVAQAGGRKVLATHHVNAIVYPSSTASPVKAYISLPSGVFPWKPDSFVPNVSNGNGQIKANYDWDDASNSATQLVIWLRDESGTPIPSTTAFRITGEATAYA